MYIDVDLQVREQMYPCIGKLVPLEIYNSKINIFIFVYLFVQLIRASACVCILKHIIKLLSFVLTNKIKF